MCLYWIGEFCGLRKGFYTNFQKRLDKVSEIGYNISDFGYLGGSIMRDLHAREYTHLNGEINSLYHEAALKIGVSDSAFDILYVICENGDRCLQSEVFRLTGTSRQTINSAIRKLEKDGIVYLEPGEGRNTIVCLTDKGKKFLTEKFYPLFEIENKIWSEWTADEQQQYIVLTQKYRDALKKHLKTFRE